MTECEVTKSESVLGRRHAVTPLLRHGNADFYIEAAESDVIPSCIDGRLTGAGGSVRA